MNREALESLVSEELETLNEEEVLAILANRFCSTRVCLRIAQNTRFTALYSIQSGLVAHRKTPRGHAMRFIPHLRLRELMRCSTDVRVLPPVRRAVEEQLRDRLRSLTAGEKITLARLCSRELVRDLLRDPDARVFDAVLVNPRLHEEDLLALIEARRAGPGKLTAIANHSKWRNRYPIRRALAMDPETPPAIAAVQLRHLRRDDLRQLVHREETSRYLRLCIERLELLE